MQPFSNNPARSAGSPRSAVPTSCSCSRSTSSRSGSTGKVADAKAVDDEGSEVSVSLWNDEIDRVQAKSRIRITNGWAREWRGNLQVSAGRFGKLEVLE